MISPVDRVGDSHGVARRDQAEIADVSHVVVVGVGDNHAPGDEGLEHATDAGLGEPSDEGVEVRGAGEDQALSRGLGVVAGDRRRGGDSHLLDDLARQSVGEPGLPLAQLEEQAQRLFGEGLSCFGRVLSIERRTSASLKSARRGDSTLMLKGLDVPSLSAFPPLATL